MATSPLTGFPYLLAGDAPDLAGITLAMAQWADSGDVLLQATDEADRDSRYGDVPSPALCISKSRPAVWLKIADTGTSSDWRTIWSDSGWVTAGFTASASFSATVAKVRKLGERAEVNFVGVTNADFPTVTSGIHMGNVVGDPVIITIPAGYRPSYQVTFSAGSSFGSWGARINPDGTVTLADGPPGATLSVGDQFTFSATYLTT